MDADKRRHKGRRYIGSFILYGVLAAGYLGLAWRCRELNRSAECLLYALLGCVSLALMISPFRPRRREKTSKAPFPRRFRVLVSDLLIVAFVLPMGMTAVLYESFFLHRQITPESAVVQIDDEQEIEVIPSPFRSNWGQTLSGYFYRQKDTEPETVLILAHGSGSGHTAYMNVIEFFAQNGCLVFAYDATGYDESGGLTMRGLPQGIIDLEYAIRHVCQSEPAKGKPLVLFGHSWGAYSVCSVLMERPDIKAVISLAGYDSSLQIIEEQGRKLIGSAVTCLLPHFSLYEHVKFGRYASCSSLDGFANTDARIMIVHSADDDSVPIRLGCDLFREQYGADERFTFVRFTDRGHERLFSEQDAERYLDFILP